MLIPIDIKYPNRWVFFFTVTPGVIVTPSTLIHDAIFFSYSISSYSCSYAYKLFLNDSQMYHVIYRIHNQREVEFV